MSEPSTKLDAPVPDEDRINSHYQDYVRELRDSPPPDVEQLVELNNQESAQWADRVAQGQYDYLDAANQQARDLKAARRRVRESTGRATGLRQVEPGFDDGILNEPARPPQPEAPREQSLEELFASAEAPDQHVPRLDRQTAHDPALHPREERLATPEDELIHHGIPPREPRPPQHQAEPREAPAPHQAAGSPERPRLHHRVVHRVKSLAKRLRRRS